MKILKLVVILSTMTLVACTGADDEAEARRAAEEKARQEQEAMIRAGAELFAQNCESCHPHSGRGDYLKRIPATLLTRRSEQELKAWIKGTGEHREMPNFDNLTDRELEALTQYLHAQIFK